MCSMKENIHPTTQIIASMVDAENLNRARELAQDLSRQDSAFADALRQVQQVREFVGSPEHILGNLHTKHGEIAEQVEVGIRNARDLVHQLTPTASFDGIGRTAPADYCIDQVEVQSKFVNGVGKNLEHVLNHMKQYEYFGRNGSYYHVPKDQYEVMQRVAQGEMVEGLSQTSIQKIREKIQAVEQLSGRPFHEVVKPGISNYSEVQQGKVQDTLDRHEQELKETQKDLKDKIRLEHQPSLGEMAKVAAQGAVIGAGLQVTFKLFEKYRQGKNPFKGDFTSADWQELGFATAQGGATGGVSGAALYGLTNFANLSAPLAGAVISAGFAVVAIGKRYADGDITLDEFLELGQIACAESAIVALSAAIGQAVIPVPVLGALVGTIAGRMIMSFGKPYLGEAAEKLQKRLAAYYNQCLAKIDRAYQEVIAQIIIKYERLGDLTQAAFDQTKNTALRLQNSIQLAEVYGVPQTKIIHTIDELDAFMLS
jgi:gas vesicle protein